MAEKKGLFSNLFGKKDDKVDELAEAKKEAEAAKKAIKDMMDKRTEESIEKSEELREAKEKIEELQKETKEDLKVKFEEERKKRLEQRKEMLEEAKEKLEAQAKSKLLAQHTVQSGETLSHIALKYYNHATPPYWKLLLEANKEALKGSELNVRSGMVIDVPELPEDLKD